MRMYLINPYNPLVSLVNANANRWNQYTVWKPLSLLVLAGLTPSEWTITIFDENIQRPDYASLPPADLVGITAFTSQANRAYDIAGQFRKRNIPVVMGGIHATMCADEAADKVDTVVTGEAESVWQGILGDFQKGVMRRRYNGEHLKLERVPVARHDLLTKGYRFGSIQTSRGCPLSCNFCSVTAFNGGKFRRRPIEDVIREFRLIKEKYILVVDDNLIGTRKDHISYTKNMLRAMIKADVRKKWIAQATINMADDEELLSLASKAGCFGVFIGFESTSVEGLEEIHKKFLIQKVRDMKASVRRMQRHGIAVVGSFIIGLDVDSAGIGADIASTGLRYGLDALNVMFLTPLPGTRLWDKMKKENRIIANDFPEDWKYYTLTFPVAKYKNLSWREMVKEKQACYRAFYSYPRILGRVFRMMMRIRNPITILASNLLYRVNTLRLDREIYEKFDFSRGDASAHI